MRAACTAASCRASNSDWVTMSPFTLATTRSMISAREEAERTRAPRPRRRPALRRTRTRDRFMIHLGSGHEALDELADAGRGFLTEEVGARRLPALGQAGFARGESFVDAQDVVPERA